MTSSTRPWLLAAIHTAICRPRVVLSIWAVLAALAGAGVARLDFDTSTGSVLDRSAPAWLFYQESVERFGGDEIIAIAVEGRYAYDPEALAEVVRLTDYAEGLPGVRRVDSLSTFRLIRSTPAGDLTLDTAMEDGPPRGDHEAAEVAARVAGDRIALGSLVSRDGKVFAINVLLDADSADMEREIIESIDAVIDAERTWVSGVPVFRTEVNARTRAEILIFVPVTVGTIALLLMIVFGSVGAAVISLLASAAGMLLALGAMGALGTPVTISTMILPSILLALGSAYVMHVLAVARGVRDPAELERALGLVATPIALSGLTTAIGFVALSTVRIDAIRELGGFGALGVIGVLCAALTFVPAALRLHPLGDGPQGLEAFIRGQLRGLLLGLVASRRRLVLAIWSALLVAFSIGLARLEVETDAIVWFPRGSPVRDSYERIRDYLSGISPMNVVIEAVGEGEVTRPDLVATIDRLGRHLEGLPEVGKVVSLADPLAQIHAGFTDGSPEIMPDDQALIEQYLMLLSSVEYLDDVVSRDRLSANVLLRVDNNGSEDLVSVARKAEAWWAQHGTEGFRARATGIMYEFARSENEIAWGQIRGLAFAVIAIGAVLFAIFRWPTLAGVAIVPNVVPLIMVFGFMGIAGIPLDAVTVGLGSTALGIAVDDTIHVVSGYRTGMRADADPLEALNLTFRRILPPLVYTTIAIALGFGVLSLSNFTVTRNLGLVTSGVVVLCLLADLTLLPALLAVLREKAKGVARAVSGDPQV